MSVARSKAIVRPIMEIRRAVSLRLEGMVSTGVLIRSILRMIMSPPIILPQASRLRGLITEGLFSLMGE